MPTDTENIAFDINQCAATLNIEDKSVIKLTLSTVGIEHFIRNILNKYFVISSNCNQKIAWLHPDAITL